MRVNPSFTERSSTTNCPDALVVCKWWVPEGAQSAKADAPPRASSVDTPPSGREISMRSHRPAPAENAILFPSKAREALIMYSGLLQIARSLRFVVSITDTV